MLAEFFIVIAIFLVIGVAFFAYQSDVQYWYGVIIVHAGLFLISAVAFASAVNRESRVSYHYGFFPLIVAGLLQLIPVFASCVREEQQKRVSVGAVIISASLSLLYLITVILFWIAVGQAFVCADALAPGVGGVCAGKPDFIWPGILLVLLVISVGASALYYLHTNKQVEAHLHDLDALLCCMWSAYDEGAGSPGKKRAPQQVPTFVGGVRDTDVAQLSLGIVTLVLGVVALIWTIGQVMALWTPDGEFVGTASFVGPLVFTIVTIACALFFNLYMIAMHYAKLQAIHTVEIITNMLVLVAVLIAAITLTHNSYSHPHAAFAALYVAFALIILGYSVALIVNRQATSIVDSQVKRALSAPEEEGEV